MPEDPARETEWVLVKHVRFPMVEDTVIGRYPSETDALRAYNEVQQHRQWFTEYSVEHRFRGEAHPYKEALEQQRR